MEDNRSRALPSSSSMTELIAETMEMSTITLMSTSWTQVTVYVESGTVQLPVVTIYSSLQPVEMASYPDPIMSATGTDLQWLLSSKAAQSSTSLTSEASFESASATAESRPTTDSSPTSEPTATPTLATSPKAITSSFSAPDIESSEQEPSVTSDEAVSTQTSMAAAPKVAPQEVTTTVITIVACSTSAEIATASDTFASPVSTTALTTIAETIPFASVFATPSTHVTVYTTDQSITSSSAGEIVHSSTNSAEPQLVKSTPLVVSDGVSTVEVQSSDAGDLSIPLTNTVVPITTLTVTQIDDDTAGVHGRRELARDVRQPQPKPAERFEEQGSFRTNPINHSLDDLTIILWVTIVALVALLIVRFVKNSQRKSPDDPWYTSKPPRPGLRKRLSLSMPVHRHSNPTEAMYVSGNAVSIGKSAGQGLVVGEVRRTPSTPLLEV